MAQGEEVTEIGSAMSSLPLRSLGGSTIKVGDSKEKTYPPNSRVGGSNSTTSLGKAWQKDSEARPNSEAKNGSFRGVSCGF